jgi:hypothetical protein
VGIPGQASDRDIDSSRPQYGHPVNDPIKPGTKKFLEIVPIGSGYLLILDQPLAASTDIWGVAILLAPEVFSPILERIKL